MVDTGLLDWAGVAERMSLRPGPDRPGRRPRPPDRGGRAGQRRALRPVGAPHGRGRASRPRCRATRRTPAWSCPAGWSRRSCAARPPCSTGSSAVTRRDRRLLVLEDGRTFRGEAYGADGRDLRRGGLQHRHDRLPGDADRPVVPPPGRGDDRAAHRQHRHQRRGPRVPADLGGRLRRARPRPGPVQLALAAHPRRRAARAGRRRHLRHRHPGADPPPARARRDAGRASPRPRPTPAALLARVREAAQMAGAELAGEVSTTEAVRRARPSARSGSPSPRRPRHQGDDARR